MTDETRIEPVPAASAWDALWLESNRSRWCWRLERDTDVDRWVRELTATDAAGVIDEAPAAVATLAGRLGDELENGVGSVLVEVDRPEEWDDREMVALFWELGHRLGTVLPQNAAGHFLGHVRDEHLPAGPQRRGYHAGGPLEFHNDYSDVVGLLCLRPAAEGGDSLVCSATRLFNELCANRPELVPALFDWYYFHWAGEEPDGFPPYYRTPMYSYWAGKLSMRFSKALINQAQLHLPECPRLSPEQERCIASVLELAHDKALHARFALRRGILHARTDFTDSNDPAAARHLVRLWVAPPRGRPLGPRFGEKYGRFSQPGSLRGGVVLRPDEWADPASRIPSRASVLAGV